MTVTADIARWDYTGNGVLTTYPFTAEIYAATDLKVYVSDVLQVLNVNYTIAVSSIFVPAGGNVVFTAGSIPALSAPVSIILDLPLTQLVDYIEGDKFPAEVHERALDRLIKIAQSFSQTLTRVAKLPVSSLLDLIFPNPVANQYIGWNAAADNLENKALPVVTTATQYEVDALISYGGGTSFTKATIDATLTAVGIVNPVTVLLRPGAWNIDADADYSTYTNVSFRIPNGSYFDVDALMTLTLPSPDNIKAQPNQQIFTGAGTVSFSAGGTVYPNWWAVNTTPGTTDMRAAIQAAADSITAGGILDLGSESYRISKVQGTNDSYGVKITNSGVTVRGNGATLRRAAGITTYAFAHPIILIGTPDSNVAAASEDVVIEGITFIGEDTRHAVVGSYLHDGRYAIELKNTKGVIIQNNKFTKVDSSAIFFQSPAIYDYVSSTYYNSTKNYNAKILNNTFIAEPHAVAERGLIHAIVISGVDNFISSNNYFEWCDDAFAGEGTYDDYDDVETDVYASGTAVGDVKRTGRGWIIKGDQIYNSSEHALYLGGMDVDIDVKAWTDSPTICTGDLKIYGRNVNIKGSVLAGKTALHIYMLANNVTSTASLTTLKDSEGGVVSFSTYGLKTFMDNRPWIGAGTYRPMENINIGGSIILPTAAQTYGYGIRIITDSSSASFPEGQIRSVKISANIKNHRVGIYFISALARNILVDGCIFDSKPFTSASFDNTTTMNTHAVIMVAVGMTSALQAVQFSNNKISGSTYVFATDTGAGTALTNHLPYGIMNNRMSYVKNFSTGDFRNIKVENRWAGNGGEYFLDGKAATTFTSESFSTATHNYGAGTTDWTLSTVEANADHLIVTNASGGINALLTVDTYVAGHKYSILNTSGQILTFKRATGGTIANGKLALYITGANDVFEVWEQP